MAQQCEETGGANSAENAPSHPVLPLAVTAKIHPGWGQCIPLLLPNVELLSPSSSAGMLRNRVERALQSHKNPFLIRGYLQHMKLTHPNDLQHLPLSYLE